MSKLMKQEENALSTQSIGVDLFAQDSGAGLENVDKSSFAIPFITLLQGLSPQLETVDGAKPGLFINTITNELFKEVVAIPCAYQRRYLRWAKRSEGGGFKGEYSPIDVETGKIEGAIKNDEGRYVIGSDELNDTRNHFVLVQSESGIWQHALICLTSTQIKKSKRWMSRIQGLELRSKDGKAFTPPSFSHIYTIKSVKEENSKGSWWGLEVNLKEAVSDPEVYLKAKEFHKSVTAGEVQVAMPENVNEVYGDVNNSNDKF